jgi:hypothetical protein
MTVSEAGMFWNVLECSSLRLEVGGERLARVALCLQTGQLRSSHSHDDALRETGTPCNILECSGTFQNVPERESLRFRAIAYKADFRRANVHGSVLYHKVWSSSGNTFNSKENSLSNRILALIKFT